MGQPTSLTPSLTQVTTLPASTVIKNDKATYTAGELIDLLKNGSYVVEQRAARGHATKLETKIIVVKPLKLKVENKEYSLNNNDTKKLYILLQANQDATSVTPKLNKKGKLYVDIEKADGKHIYIGNNKWFAGKAKTQDPGNRTVEVRAGVAFNGDSKNNDKDFTVKNGAGFSGKIYYDRTPVGPNDTRIRNYKFGLEYNFQKPDIKGRFHDLNPSDTKREENGVRNSVLVGGQIEFKATKGNWRFGLEGELFTGFVWDQYSNDVTYDPTSEYSLLATKAESNYFGYNIKPSLGLGAEVKLNENVSLVFSAAYNLNLMGVFSGDGKVERNVTVRSGNREISNSENINAKDLGFRVNNEFLVNTGLKLSFGKTKP
ncbi:MAG: hypothetical protein JW841_12805 [Deltaproteobacteria bacterium]|nr:hypothetical protein [Deltaproteobacteria bacterium]